MDKIISYREFWPVYLRAHRDPRTRICHYMGTSLAVFCWIMALVYKDWRWFLASPFIGYGFAWIGHGFFEHNKPATFGHPLWSFFSDFRMLGLWLCGRLEQHQGSKSSSSLKCTPRDLIDERK